MVSEMVFLLATNNPGKSKEIRPLFEEAGLKLISLADLGLGFEAAEDGDTFTHNAIQKATETAAYLKEHGHNFAIIADDSGLEIDALDGEPGVDSALYMGRETPFTVKCQNLIGRLTGIPGDARTARFICVIACVWPDGSTITTEASIEGRITHEISGEDGFGYDPIFFYPPFKKTMAQMSKDEKNAISHRGQAIQKMIGLMIDATSGNK